MNARATSIEDLPIIESWIQADPWHRDVERCRPEFLLSGAGGVLAFCLYDDKGLIAFVRLDADGRRIRLATQFAPESEVSKRRLLLGMTRIGIPLVLKFAKDRGYESVVFESVSPSLISFMARYDFKLDKGDDYMVKFEEIHDE